MKSDACVVSLTGGKVSYPSKALQHLPRQTGLQKLAQLSTPAQTQIGLSSYSVEGALLYYFHPQCGSQAFWKGPLRGCVSICHTSASLQRAAAVPENIGTCYKTQ